MALDTGAFERKVSKAVDLCRGRAQVSRLLVGLSGGKDSLCLCELVKMAEATDVRYFNMEFLPGLRIQFDMLQYACRRFNIPYDDIIRVPSEHFIKCMHYCLYTWHNEQAKKDFPDISRKKVYAHIAREYQGTIVTGVKRSDGLMMMRKVDQNKSNELMPLKDWTLQDVLMFLKLRNIALPELGKRGVRGVGIEDGSLLYIHDHYPDDWERILEYFPFVGAMVYKYKYFDIKKTARRV